MLMEPNPPQKKTTKSMVASFVAHVVVIGILAYRPAAMFVSPNFVKLGDGPKNTHVVYVAPDGTDEPETQRDKLALKSAPKKHHKQKTTVKPLEAPTSYQEGEVAARNKKVGVPYGSLWALMEQGHDVKPAIPVEYPSPDLSRADLPFGFQGDVVIEVTIDKDGFVVDWQVLQSVGHGVDEKAVAAVQRWKFRPAILDGSPIASKHDVHFHVPS